MLRDGVKTRFTVDEYLGVETVSQERNEYYDGVIYEMPPSEVYRKVSWA